ncbi:MAG: radical SAM protein [Treponema sp.]|jgi:DNA repair photolyase|nr:radical SAM protein [Treponema sp.]
MEFIPAKTIVTPVKGQSWFGVDYNMNIYRGCPHGCIYCDSRSLCYKIEDFDRVRAKQDALRIIAGDLAKKRNRGVVASGAMSDPYNPLEAEQRLTRSALELLNARGFGAAIATKSDLVVRDIPVLQAIQAHSPVIVKMTITAADDGLGKTVEPRAPLSSRRFAAVKALNAGGIYTGILMMPVLPFIEDTEENITALVHAAKASGARFIYPAFGVTLRAGNREYFYEQLDKHVPGIKARYIKRYSGCYSCTSPEAKRLRTLFTAECQRLGLCYEMRDIIAGYRRGYTARQLELF